MFAETMFENNRTLDCGAVIHQAGEIGIGGTLCYAALTLVSFLEKNKD